MPEEPFYSAGLQFSCKRCSACCRFDPGYVFLTYADAEKLRWNLDMQQAEFEKTYCRWIQTGSDVERLSLKEKSNYDCIFWKEGCVVYEARPASCKTYPFWQDMLVSKEVWEETSASCPGAGQGMVYDRSAIEACLEAESGGGGYITRKPPRLYT